MHLVYPGSGYILLYILDQDILLYPGYTAGRTGGVNPAAGMERLLDLDVDQVGRLLDLEQQQLVKVKTKYSNPPRASEAI